MNVITLEEEAFYELYYKLVAEIKQQLGAKPRNKWIDGNEAMAMLHIKSRTTLQKLRDEGMGLNNVQSRIRPYNGEVEIISRPGRGTRYEITVPIGK